MKVRKEHLLTQPLYQKTFGRVLMNGDSPAEHIAAPGAREIFLSQHNSRLTLDALPFGTEALVVTVNGTDAVAKRLMEMGVVPGAPVCLIKAAPLGDPLEVRVRNYHLALRRAEARTITVSIRKS